jgi:Tfp pilus assembly protein PilN
VTRQPDFSTTSRRSRAPAWQWLALAACAVVALGALAGAFTARDEARSAAGRLLEVNHEVEAASARLAALQARARVPGGVALLAEEAPPARIAAELASVLPDEVRLQRLTIDYQDGGRLELEVVARDAAAWDRLLQRMEAAPRLREVEPGPEARAGEVRSLVRARWAGGAR